MNTGSKYCVYCDLVIQGVALVIPLESASGARPNNWAHEADDPACEPASRRRRVALAVPSEGKGS
ncbi:hypothetical protein ACFY04_14140 [Streptomyces sp. NPDC001549]|uniref:hypothetical protein n=1 Tax=Streptomyces sp. NPDC001549 TaxID=3364586 RepID=UPI00367D267F